MLDTAKLFKNGQSQAVRLPKKFRLQGDHVYIKKEGNKIILIPIETAWWKPLVDSLTEFLMILCPNAINPKKRKKESGYLNEIYA